MSAHPITVWSWREGITKSGLQPTTRLVLLTLAVHMNDLGEGCYPSTKTLEAETGLSERSICTHLDLAEKAGWVKKVRHGYGGQKWARHEYVAAFPEGFTLKREAPTSCGEGEEKGTEGGSVPREKGTEPLSKGTEPDDKKALKEVQSNSPENSPYNSTDSTTGAQVRDANEGEEGFTTTDGVEAYHSSTDEQKAEAERIIHWLDDFFRPIRPMHHGYVFAWVKWGYRLEADVKPAAQHWRSRYPHRQIGSYQWLESIMELNAKARNRERPQGHHSGDSTEKVLNPPPEPADLSHLPAEAYEVAARFIGAHGEACYRNWIGKCQFTGVRDGLAYYAAPTNFIRQHILTNYLHLLRELWKAHAVEDVRFVFHQPTSPKETKQ